MIMTRIQQVVASRDAIDAISTAEICTANNTTVYLLNGGGDEADSWSLVAAASATKLYSHNILPPSKHSCTLGFILSNTVLPSRSLGVSSLRFYQYTSYSIATLDPPSVMSL
jgi:hypothetical protein